MGESPPGFTFPAPSVPVRSQSGDPAAQFAAGAHDRAVFPLGSVQRDRDAFPHDPQGEGSFGDRKSTRLNSSHTEYLVCRLLLEKKKRKKRNKLNI